jgi:hypothetical protein
LSEFKNNNNSQNEFCLSCHEVLILGVRQVYELFLKLFLK